MPNRYIRIAGSYLARVQQVLLEVTVEVFVGRNVAAMKIG